MNKVTSRRHGFLSSRLCLSLSLYTLYRPPMIPFPPPHLSLPSFVSVQQRGGPPYTGNRLKSSQVKIKGKLYEGSDCGLFPRLLAASVPRGLVQFLPGYHKRGYTFHILRVKRFIKYLILWLAGVVSLFTPATDDCKKFGNCCEWVKESACCVSVVVVVVVFPRVVITALHFTRAVNHHLTGRN